MANTIMCDCCLEMEKMSHDDSCPKSENYLEPQPYLECPEANKIYMELPIFVKDAGLFKLQKGKYDINRVIEALQRAHQMIEGKLVICHLSIKALNKLQKENWPRSIVFNTE